MKRPAIYTRVGTTRQLGTRRSRWHDVSAVPSWLLTRFLIRSGLPPSHPWHRRHFTLAEWRRGRTILVCQLDLIFAVMFWVLVSSATLLLVSR